jgi:signal transduction histidine kinase
MSEYRLSDLIDVNVLQKMGNSLYQATGISIGIMDAIDGSALVASGWQDICVKFHRANPVSCQRCRESDDYIKSRLVEGEACRYKCKNGLWDMGIPIVVGGRHLATLFIGQFFYEDEIPDREFFIQLAHELGFDVASYLAALDRVHVFSREKIESILEYNKTLASFIADLAAQALLKIEADQRLRDIESREMAERKQSEKEKQQLQDQLAQAQKMESIGRLAGGVAHDFNNQLSIIIGYAETSLAKLRPSDLIYENLREIISAGHRSANVVRQLLAFARKQTINPKIININDAVEDVLKMLRRLIGENIDLVWKPHAGIGLIKMDPSQIDQLLANLIINARDAIRDVGKVIIETATVTVDPEYYEIHLDAVPGDYAMLSVSDDGCGMDKTTLSNIFEPFFTTKDVGQGTGLGLATVYGIIKQNKGFINVYSEPGQGSTFKIYIPQCRSAEALSGETAASAINQAGNETVLLVEDEAIILELVKIQLTSMGYTVLAAHTPDEAFRFVEEFGREIHLLMTDVVMPNMNGRELAKSLLLRYPKLKHLFMSGYTANVIAHHGILDEGTHFIQKPFTLKQLAGKVREALDS